MPIAYWIENKIINHFKANKLGSIAEPRSGLSTTDNNRFLRYWQEVNYNHIKFNCSDVQETLFINQKWYPYNKGGHFRKWFGNQFYVVNWFKTELNNYKKRISKIVLENISISKTDWDSFETSWNFKVHPLLNKEFNPMHLDVNTGLPNKTIENAYEIWKAFANSNFNQLKANEEELNRIFMEIYGLEDKLTLEVSDKDITITKIFNSKEEIYDDIKGNRYILTKEDVIKSFISYAVGCMFGRYSPDIEGLAYAGEEFKEQLKIENGEWKIRTEDGWISSSIDVAEDNVIVITDEEYLGNDIVSRFVDFVRVCYGEESLEKNLKFIADALGGKGTPREVIRNYFLKDFYSDHVRTYQKRPIYWLYNSGR